MVSEAIWSKIYPLFIGYPISHAKWVCGIGCVKSQQGVESHKSPASKIDFARRPHRELLKRHRKEACLLIDLKKKIISKGGKGRKWNLVVHIFHPFGTKVIRYIKPQRIRNFALKCSPTPCSFSPPLNLKWDWQNSLKNLAELFFSCLGDDC